MSTEVDPQLVYVIGVDGTGKSTLINQIVSTREGYTFMEATSTDAAREFKNQNFEMLIDATFINQREALFADIAQDFENQFHQMHANRQSVVTTGGALVTRLSHQVMRTIVGDSSSTYEDVLSEWVRDESLVRPTAFIHLHAPIQVLLARIATRHTAGDITENRWGFNSPHFLNHYQEAWHHTRGFLESIGVRCVSIDTSTHDKTAMSQAALDILP
jgi:deoxyadenosine/deoxycytidine kinase